MKIIIGKVGGKLHKVSVVIPAYNEENVIAELLDRLYIKGTRKPDEIILVDANSADETVNIAQNWKKENLECNLKIIELKTKAYPGRARNIGVQNASFSYIAFIDCGVMPEENWLGKLVKPFQKDENVEVVWGQSYSKVETAWENAFAFIVEKKRNQTRVVRSSSIKKETFFRVGMFREDLRAAEDLLYIQAIVKANVKEVFVNAVAWYTGYPSSFFQAFRKWATYSQNDIRANTYYKKLVLVLMEILIFIGVIFICVSILRNVIFIPIGLFLLLVCRVLMNVRRSSTKLGGFGEFFMAMGISVSIDLGRLTGLLLGLVKYKLLRLKVN